MTVLQVAEFVIGIVVLAAGGVQTWRTWGRLRGLQAREANLRRYDAWRGGRRSVPGGPSEAEVAATELRRGIGIAGSIALVGVILIIFGALGR